MAEESAKEEDAKEPEDQIESSSRREFVEKAGSICAGCALVGIPVAAGVGVVVDPVRLPPGDAKFLKVA